MQTVPRRRKNGLEEGAGLGAAAELLVRADVVVHFADGKGEHEYGRYSAVMKKLAWIGAVGRLPRLRTRAGAAN